MQVGLGGKVELWRRAEGARAFGRRAEAPCRLL